MGHPDCLFLSHHDTALISDPTVTKSHRIRLNIFMNVFYARIHALLFTFRSIRYMSGIYITLELSYTQRYQGDNSTSVFNLKPTGQAVSNLFNALGLPVTRLPIAILSASLSTTPPSPSSSSSVLRMSTSISFVSPVPLRMEGVGTRGKLECDWSISGIRSLRRSERRLLIQHVSCRVWSNKGPGTYASSKLRICRVI
ncbi:hypothetical protein PILCRDRAFT_309231 [Piloderma croceum F 1598]|uniref:Uncharacterized protein n=1 Tax=Piloderma croceum (strain F 1598) TaxID=765440 RepID=A0A0C3BJT4_PILCF|nr:hypothetical protein PILCRDRAFT_309231 [Piloderma croceum F 1598]